MKTEEKRENGTAINRLIGIRIGKLRAAKGMTQGDLAERIGISRSALAHLEAGERVAKAETLVSLARVLDCSADYLLGLNDFPHQDGDLSVFISKTGLDVLTVSRLVKESSISNETLDALTGGESSGVCAPVSTVGFLNYIVSSMPDTLTSMQANVAKAVQLSVVASDGALLSELLEREKDSELLLRIHALGGTVVPDTERIEKLLKDAEKSFSDVLRSYVTDLTARIATAFFIGQLRARGGSMKDILAVLESTMGEKGDEKHG